LSGGERKILAFCMALIHTPILILFDEPFAGVDVRNAITLYRLFNKTIIQPENIVLIVEHKADTKRLYSRDIKIELGKTKISKK
jgi:ABC-type Mn2+/Zn2+ transport system ATPase subunit